MSESSKITQKLVAAKQAGKEAEAKQANPPTEPKPYRAPRPKRTRAAGPRQRLPVTVGGVEVSPEDAVAALEILTASPGIMVKQPLLRAGNPLSECDYHGFANEVRESDPELAKLNTKPAFMAGLARLTGR